MAITALVIGLPAVAGAVSGRQKDVMAAPMAYFEQIVPAIVGYTFETRNLAPSSADTVIHVQDGNDANGGFVAGNDDFNGLASKVTVAPASTDRFLQIIVRAYGSRTGGTGQLVRTASTGAVTVDNITFGGVSIVSIPSGVQATGHVVIPGIRVAGAPAAATTVIWDEGPHAPTACDTDSISDSLEQALGTDPCNNDTDAPGRVMSASCATRSSGRR